MFGHAGRLALVAFALAAGGSAQSHPPKSLAFFKPGAIRALVFSGRNNHDWRATTPALRKLLEDTGRFDVRVVEEPAGVTAETLAVYDVLVLDYCGTRWGVPTERAVEEFVRAGKGLVVFHAATYPFGESEVLGNRYGAPRIFEPVWEEYRKLTGAYWVRDREPRSGHGDRHTFRVKFANREHPISKGMDESFLATDELYHNLRMMPGVPVLATAYDDPTHGGTGKDEPILWSLSYGKGRVFQTALGHDTTGIAEPGFISTFVRGAEWAARGSVSLPPSPRARPQVRVLVTAGDHAIDTSFYTLFEHEEISWTLAGSDAFATDLRGRFDAVVLFSRIDGIGADGRENLRGFLENGGGALALHHGTAEGAWPWWRKEVGGAAFSEDAGAAELFVKSAGQHPLTSGMALHVRDTPPKGAAPADASVLLASSMASVAWISPYKNARVVFMRLGHDRSTHRYPAYRQFVRNAIEWVARQPAR
jgi:uncharacterized protein